MIKLLTEDTIQKIAAGEVIESPASIVKELVENSIDSGADEIYIEIKNGGKSYVKVSDNGCGINKDEVELAFTRHATSKISKFSDLYSILSMGFRGEALASIVAVSKVSVMTKTIDSNIGIHIIYDNNKIIKKQSIGMNSGTIIEVENLFEYIPVRKKFLKSDISEGNKITNLIYSFAIGNTDISFTYVRDSREIIKTNKKNSKTENLQILFGKDFLKNSIELNSSNKNYKISGRISNQNFYKGNRSAQYIFVNNRYIVNEDIVSTVESNYTSMIPNGRFPAFILNIDTDPQNIDINISPNKQKIKFDFADELLALISGEIQESLIKAKNAYEIEIGEKVKSLHDFSNLNELQSYKRVLEAYNPTKKIEKYEKDFDVNISIIDFNDEDEFSEIDDRILVYEPDSKKDNFSDDENNEKQKSYIDDLGPMFKTVLFGKYLIFEKSSDEIVIIDKNRAYEKIMYEKYRAQFENDTVISQELISPCIIELDKRVFLTYEKNKETIAKLGFVTDVFGENIIAIRAFPYVMEKILDEKVFRAILDEIDNIDENAEKNKILLKKAVSNSVNNISRNEEYINNLYFELMKYDNPYKSPHGKDIIYTMDSATFKRILR